MSFLNRLKSDQRGYALLQTFMSLGILLIASTTTMGVFAQAIGLTHTAKHYTEAVYVANAQMEIIKGTEFGDITTEFPSGVSQAVKAVVCHSDETMSVAQTALPVHLGHGDTLGSCNESYDNERIWLPDAATWTVSYPKGTYADPLAITVTVSWPEKGTTKLAQLTVEVTSL